MASSAGVAASRNQATVTTVSDWTWTEEATTTV